MMKKKKIQAEEINQEMTGEMNNNGTGSREDENTEVKNEASFDNSVLNSNTQTQNGSGGEPKAEPDKDVRKEPTPEEKLAEMQDRYLRLSAEFDNYRKRTLREKIELTKHAGENILLSIVPVMDDFERALKHMDNATDSAALKSGIDLIYNKFSEFLKQNGIKEIESLNQEFNVDLHDAITKVPVQDESMKGKVVDVVQKGYWLHEKVMRHAKVVVGE
jgi:molecular chaperone GrpE